LDRYGWQVKTKRTAGKILWLSDFALQIGNHRSTKAFVKLLADKLNSAYQVVLAAFARKAKRSTWGALID
jgi:hypothetical protein